MPRLTFEDRKLLEKMNAEGESASKIARTLNVHTSTVTRTLNVGVNPETGQYDALYDQQRIQAEHRKRKGKPLQVNVAKLYEQQVMGQIASYKMLTANILQLIEKSNEENYVSTYQEINEVLTLMKETRGMIGSYKFELFESLDYKIAK